LEKLSKSLITLSDCPFFLNRLPVFLGKSPCFREKTGKVMAIATLNAKRWCRRFRRPPDRAVADGSA
ncbi:MAG TPA: hypothetical protein VHJ99_14550, partial [Candidatus Dormibacteraeota bacterium]|nr:hypothetical protein [Candidatus Dormibacteraeota bacterium]